MKYELDSINNTTVMTIHEKRLVLDILDPIYKQVVEEVNKKKEYLDSFAVGFLMDIFRAQLDNKHKFVISGVNEKISTLLKITRVNNVVNIYDSRNDALSELNK